VIATRDRAAALRDCLVALAAQTARGRFEIVVVDNGSSDGTAAVVDDQHSRGLAVRRLFVAEPNRGKARNAGIAAAAGTSLIFCDDDTVAPPGFVSAHLDARRRSPHGVVSGPIVNVRSATERPAPGPANYSRAFLCTCNAGVARSDALAVGGFDERYDLYGWEDTDLGVRLRAHGAHRVWSWDAYLYHIKPPESRSLDQRLALAREKGAMAARFVAKSPSLAVRMATGAYAANFARLALLAPPPLRRWYARVAASSPPDARGFPEFARDVLVDAAYVDELRAGLRRIGG
jgi:GT2 family glycosyltransferase